MLLKTVFPVISTFLVTAKSLVIVKSCPIVTSSGRLIVTVLLVTAVTTSLEVPLNVRLSERRATASDPESPTIFNVAAESINDNVPEPSVAST